MHSKEIEKAIFLCIYIYSYSTWEIQFRSIKLFAIHFRKNAHFENQFPRKPGIFIHREIPPFEYKMCVELLNLFVTCSRSQRDLPVTPGVFTLGGH